MIFLGFFLAVFFILLPNFSALISSDNCIRKITSTFIRIYPVNTFDFFKFYKKRDYIYLELANAWY